jgi:hypothetical protein
MCGHRILSHHSDIQQSEFKRCISVQTTMSATESSATVDVLPSKTYTAACHCNKIKYTVTHSPPLTDSACEVVDCNCSICSRNGYLFIYIPDNQVVFANGALEDMTVRLACPLVHFSFLCCR